MAAKEVLIKTAVAITALTVAAGLSACQPDERYSERKRAQEAAATTLPDKAKCDQGRLFGDVTCTLTMAEVEALMDIDIPDSADTYKNTYQAFQDWIMESTFLIDKADATAFTNLADFPGVTIDGPHVSAPVTDEGVFRSVQLVSAGDRVRVALTANTT
jgi:hypothetical protein